MIYFGKNSKRLVDKHSVHHHCPNLIATTNTFSDNGNLNSGNLPICSGNYSNGDNAGTFYLNVNQATSNANANLSTQLMFSNILKMEKFLPWLLPKYKNF